MRCSTDLEPEVLRVARVGLGALGVVTEVTLQCVPAFDLHAHETVEVLDDVLDRFAEHAAAVDHFELYWMPGTRRCQVKRNVADRRAAGAAAAAGATSATSGSGRTSPSGWCAGSVGGSRR